MTQPLFDIIAPDRENALKDKQNKTIENFWGKEDKIIMQIFVTTSYQNFGHRKHIFQL